jgi:hypothetical protein
MIMLKQTSTVALLLTTFSIAVAMSPGCGGSTTRKPADGGAGAGGGTAGAGTAGEGTAGAGTAGAGTAGAGTAGAGTAGAGTAGVDGGTAGAGTAGAAGAGTAGAAPPVVTAGPAVIELDDVIVSLKAAPDGGVDAGTDGAVSDGGVDGSSDGAVSSDGGVDGGDAASDGPVGPPNVGVSYTFDTTALGWKFSPYGSSSLTNSPTDATNLALTSTLAWSATDDADGHSTSGVLKGNIQYKYLGDRIDFQAFTQATAKYDWTGYTVSAKVKLVSGGNLAFGCPLQADIYISDSANYNTKVSAKVNLVTGGWVTVTWDTADALTAGVDITKVTQLGLQIDTGPACVGTTPPDAGIDAPADMAPSDAPADTVTGADAAADGGVDSAGN